MCLDLEKIFRECLCLWDDEGDVALRKYRRELEIVFRWRTEESPVVVIKCAIIISSRAQLWDRQQGARWSWKNFVETSIYNHHARAAWVVFKCLICARKPTRSWSMASTEAVRMGISVDWQKLTVILRFKFLTMMRRTLFNESQRGNLNESLKRREFATQMYHQTCTSLLKHG